MGSLIYKNYEKEERTSFRYALNLTRADASLKDLLVSKNCFGY